MKGEQLDLASTADDVKVNIGNETCRITELRSTSVTCKAPDTLPPGRNDQGELDSKVLPIVKVLISSNLNTYHVIVVSRRHVENFAKCSEMSKFRNLLTIFRCTVRNALGTNMPSICLAIPEMAFEISECLITSKSICMAKLMKC